MALLLAHQPEYDTTSTAKLLMQGLGEVASFTNTAAAQALERSRQTQTSVIEQTKIQQDAISKERQRQHDADVNDRLNADLQLRQQKFWDATNSQRSVDQFRATGGYGGGGGGSGGDYSPRPQVSPNLPVAGEPRYNTGGNPSLPSKPTGTRPAPMFADPTTGLPNDNEIGSPIIDDGTGVAGTNIDGGAGVLPIPNASPDQPGPSGIPNATGSEPRPQQIPNQPPSPASNIRDLSGDIASIDQQIAEQQQRASAARMLPGPQGLAQSKAEEQQLNALQRSKQALQSQQTRNAEAQQRITSSAEASDARKTKEQRDAAIADPRLRKAEADASKADTQAKVALDTKDVVTEKAKSDALAAAERAKALQNKNAGGGQSSVTAATQASIQSKINVIDQKIAASDANKPKYAERLSQAQSVASKADPSVRDLVINNMMNNKRNPAPKVLSDIEITQLKASKQALQDILHNPARTAGSVDTTEDDVMSPSPSSTGNTASDGQGAALDRYAPRK